MAGPNPDGFYTYFWWDPIKKEHIYVGKGQNGRAFTMKGRNLHLVNRVKAIKAAGAEVQVGILCVESSELALLVEIEAIAKFGRRIEGTGPLLNITPGGEGVSGRKLSEEHKRKIGLAGRGRPSRSTPERNAKISQTLKGQVQTEEQKAKRIATNAAKTEEQKAEIRRKKSVSTTGLLKSEETKAKMRAAWAIRRAA